MYEQLVRSWYFSLMLSRYLINVTFAISVLVSGTDPELGEADRQDIQLVVVQVQMLKAAQVPQVVWQTGQLVFTQVHLHQVGQVAELWLHERNRAKEKNTAGQAKWQRAKIHIKRTSSFLCEMMLPILLWPS